MAQGKAPADLREREANEDHCQQQHHLKWRTEFRHENLCRDVRDQNHRDREGEEDLEKAVKRRIRQAGDVEHAVIPPNNALRADGPEADRCEKEHKRVMD